MQTEKEKKLLSILAVPAIEEVSFGRQRSTVLAILCLNMPRLITVSTRFELGKPAKWAGLGSERQTLPALLTLSFCYPAFSQLLTGKELLLENIDQNQRSNNGESNNEVVPDRNELE